MVVFNLFYEEWRETRSRTKATTEVSKCQLLPGMQRDNKCPLQIERSNFLIAKRLYVFPEPSVSNDHRGKGA
jgi:hypothetical protein